MKAGRFTVKRFIEGVSSNAESLDVILATDADRLEAAIARKDAALRRCVEWMAQDPLLPFTTEAREIYEVARAALEET